jgi:hypothetical protein
MLTNVPQGIGAMARHVVIHHPNTYNAEVYRRVLRRAEPLVGGAPTLGGMMVVSPEDEEDIVWELVGLAYALPAESYAPAPFVDRGDTTLGAGLEMRFLVEPEAMIGDPGGFEIRKDDVLYLLFGTGPEAPKIAYEIVGTEVMVNVPPFVTRYIVARRDDLDIIGPPDPDG